MLKHKLAVVTAIAVLCATAAPAATNAQGLFKNDRESTLSHINQLIKQKQDEKKNDSKNDGKNDSKNDNKGNGKGNDGKNDGKGNDGKNDGKGNDGKNDGKGNSNGNGNNNGNGNGNGNNGNNGNGNNGNGNGNGNGGNGNGNGNGGNGNGNGNNKPDPNAVNAIVKDTMNQLSALQGRCQSELVSIALQFAKATTTHQKTVLFADGKATFAGCVTSFSSIIANATLQLKAIGSDASPLDALNAGFIMFQAEGKAILNRIVG